MRSQSVLPRRCCWVCGAVTHAVAAALGHGSFAVTAKHYAQPSAIDGARTQAALGALGLEGEVPRPN